MIEDLILYKGIYITQTEYRTAIKEANQKTRETGEKLKQASVDAAEAFSHMSDAIRYTIEGMNLKKAENLKDAGISSDWEKFKESQGGTYTIIDELNEVNKEVFDSIVHEGTKIEFNNIDSDWLNLISKIIKIAKK